MRDRVMVTRTFSKCYGLAGLRVGYGVAKPELIDFLNRGRQPFNCNSLAQAGALAALDDQAHVDASVELNNMSEHDSALHSPSVALAWYPAKRTSSWWTSSVMVRRSTRICFKRV